MMKIFIFVILFFHFNASFAQKPKLRWGADIESGAPFSYTDPADHKTVIGFEVEIVELLAKEMGMEVEYVQNSWDGLIAGLNRNDYDIVVNGLEITPDRAQVVHFSKPYYYTSESLVVRASNTNVATLDDLKNKRVGTLDGSLAQRILNQLTFPLTVVGYDEEIHSYSDLVIGRLDAVLLDEAIALYYAKPNIELKVVGGPIGYMEYGVVTRLNDPKFSRRVDAALEKIIENGSVQRILEKWNLWNAMSAKAWGKSAEPLTPPVAYDKYISEAWKKETIVQKLKRYASFLPLLGKGAIMTLEISTISMVLAMILGLLTALARLYGHPVVKWLAVAYVEVFRGTPLLIQLYLIFYGLPYVGLTLDPFVAAVLGLGLNYGSCEAENYRAGILSIPKTQMDAAQALGMNWFQSLRHIILPQAVKVVIPPVTNDFIALLKDSSLVSVISMVELTTVYGQLASSSFDYLGLGLLTALVYFVIGLPFVRLARYFESQLANNLPGEQRTRRARPKLFIF